MKKYRLHILILTLSFLLVSCATVPPDRYNTQKGAAIGAGVGALLGQAIGHNTGGTLIGLAAGTILGGLVGNAVDQDYQAARDAAQYGKPVILYDKTGHAVEAIPEGVSNNPNCQSVRKRIWEDGKMIKETVEETCAPPSVHYYPPPPSYYYGWYPWPAFSSFSFSYGRPYHHGYYGYRAPYYPYHRYRW